MSKIFFRINGGENKDKDDKKSKSAQKTEPKQNDKAFAEEEIAPSAASSAEEAVQIALFPGDEQPVRTEEQPKSKEEEPFDKQKIIKYFNHTLRKQFLPKLKGFHPSLTRGLRTRRLKPDLNSSCSTIRTRNTPVHTQVFLSETSVRFSTFCVFLRLSPCLLPIPKVFRTIL